MKKKALVFVILIGLAVSYLYSDQKKGLKDIVTPYQSIKIDFENQWAFIIGISDYSKISDLNHAAYEAQKLEKLLINKYGFNPRRYRRPYRKVEHLFNKDATYEAIIRRLNWYRDNLKEDHRLFIYFSGHGFVDKDGIGYWLPHDVGKDVNISRKMKDKEIINISSKKIWNYRIVKFLEKCKAKHIFVVADSCYAGEIFSEFKGGELPAQLIKEKSRQLLAAGSSVVPDPSPFTNFLIDFLNNNNQRYLLGSTIISKARENLGKNLAPRGGYVPKTGSKGGEFILVRKLASLKPLEYKANLPTAPTDIDTSGLKAEAERKRWQEWQLDFQKEIQNQQKIDEDETVAFTSKRKSWENILSKYKKDNPDTKTTEELRKFVKGRIKYWTAIEKEELEWSTWQKKFKENVGKLEELDKYADISDSAKKAKWEELLNVYSKNNPYSREDEKLRDYAKERMFFWEGHFGRGIELRADRVELNNRFPERIQYKIFKNGNMMGVCLYSYAERTNKKGISSLKLTGFQGFGLTLDERLLTYLFSEDFSIYANFVLKGKTAISEARLKEGIGFDGKKDKELVFKKFGEPGNIQRQHFIDFKYKVIDLLSSFIVASKKVASGRFKHKEMFNFLFDNKIRVVDMVYIGQIEVPFQGRLVSTEALAIRYQYVELLRFYIFKNQHGACFPVEVKIPTIIDDPSRTVKESSTRGKPKQRKIFVSNLSFMDARTLSSMTSKEEEELLNKAVNKGMNEVKKTSNSTLSRFLHFSFYIRINSRKSLPMALF